MADLPIVTQYILVTKKGTLIGPFVTPEEATDWADKNTVPWSALKQIQNPLYVSITTLREHDPAE